jgi:cell wall-associated NlpC family hydrolase
MSFLNAGTPVEYEDMQPGDIIIYERLNGIGHVAIYMGDGKIVEAQSSKAGITDNRSVDCREIIGIRRIIH